MKLMNYALTRKSRQNDFHTKMNTILTQKFRRISFHQPYEQHFESKISLD